jgi:hypothetical protein
MRPKIEKRKLVTVIGAEILSGASCRFYFYFLFFGGFSLFIPHMFFCPLETCSCCYKTLVIPDNIILSQEFNSVGEIYQFFRSQFSPVYYILIAEDIELYRSICLMRIAASIFFSSATHIQSPDDKCKPSM